MEVDAVFGTYYIASRVPTILVRTEMRIKYANAVEKALVVSIYKCLNMYPVCPQTCVVPTGFSENCGGGSSGTRGSRQRVDETFRCTYIIRT